MTLGRSAFLAGWQALVAMWPARVTGLDEAAQAQLITVYLLALDDLTDDQWLSAVRTTLRERTSGFFPTAAELRTAAGLANDPASVERRQLEVARERWYLRWSDEHERDRQRRQLEAPTTPSWHRLTETAQRPTDD